jgi:hypothetical protein
MSNKNYNTQTNPNRQKLMNGGRAKKNMGGSMNTRADMRSGYYPSDMGMEGGAMYKKGGPVKKKSKFPDHSGDGKITKKDILMAKGVIPKKKQGYKDRKDESIAMRIKKKRTKKQLRASANESYGKFGSKAKKSGKINK